MTLTDLPVSPPWPTAPGPDADTDARLGWYAAVARWAPSKHNAQPWRFVVRDHFLEIWADPMRSLPATDPQRRELTIACGAAVHLACVAARSRGHQPVVALLPDGGGSLLARIAEAEPWVTTELDRRMLALVPLRRTDRGPLDKSALSPSVVFALQSAADAEGACFRVLKTPGERSTFAAMVLRADRLLVRSSRADEELGLWLREKGDRRDDGVPTDHTRGAAASYRAEFVQRDFSGPHSSPAQNRSGLDDPLVGVLWTAGDDTLDWLVAGRALAATLLKAAASGANSSYLNQPIEQPGIRIELREQLALSGYPQLGLRIGIGGDVTAPPRRVSSDLVFRM